MVPAWIGIAIVATAVAIALNRLPQQDSQWFFRLRRPPWLTFEGAIPFIWIFILICGIISASFTWADTAHWIWRWCLMAGYLGLEVAVMAYTPVMCKLRSLTWGTLIGGGGFLWGCILASQVVGQSPRAVLLLLPYLLWSPVGTFVTWQMIPLNPGKA
ncbi:tryptophan-rich sensory protein [Prochlorothrix hollandica]|uniref:TspO/MBR-like protein n=1 Tax=Prochlorothrix hollandica PCC 9006 = CALU 1027 TaxID=317619 RepID=A0A0M2Q178_PROHO|nr:tryptophan-rich sensory protein [Prochlorothrix hollandica]KKJ00719.1 TspO/MBR-like protein [Prochlorothrix hollandica PCC 9006 = CALU 1027]